MAAAAEPKAQAQSQDPAPGICGREGCGKPARSQCPTCIKLQLPDTFFCTQECFQAAWKSHNELHKYTKACREFVPPPFKYTGPLRPHYVSPMRSVPDHINKPDYWLTGDPVSERRARGSRPTIYTPKQLEGIRLACRLAREVLDIAANAVRPGVTTEELDRIVHEATIARGAYPSPLNYMNFPKSLCTSVNEIVCHGIPDARPLQDGDIVNLDISLFKDGYHADLNETVCVGDNVSAADKRLIYTTYQATMAAIDQARNGTMIREFGQIISKICHDEGFSVVRTYCGHGIGDLFHATPNIPHYARNKAPGVCQAGMVFTIEPMVNAGGYQDVLWPDDWTSATLDGSRSAQFEHQILVTEDGPPEILTARTANSRPFWWELPGVDVEAVLREGGSKKFGGAGGAVAAAGEDGEAAAAGAGEGEGAAGAKKKKKKNKKK